MLLWHCRAPLSCAVQGLFLLHHVRSKHIWKPFYSGKAAATIRGSESETPISRICPSTFHLPDPQNAHCCSITCWHRSCDSLEVGVVSAESGTSEASFITWRRNPPWPNLTAEISHPTVCLPGRRISEWVALFTTIALQTGPDS